MGVCTIILLWFCVFCLEPNVFSVTQLCIVVTIGLLLVGIGYIMSRVSVCMFGGATELLGFMSVADVSAHHTKKHINTHARARALSVSPSLSSWNEYNRVSNSPLVLFMSTISQFEPINRLLQEFISISWYSGIHQHRPRWFPAVSSYNMADARICKAGRTLAA